MLSGSTQTEVINGKGTFKKISITEVTSHFRNSSVFLVVYA